MVFILSFRAGIYGTETGLFSRKIILLFLIARPRVLQAVLPPFFRSYEKSTKKVREGCAHPLDSHGYVGRYVLFSLVRKKYQKSTQRACEPS